MGALDEVEDRLRDIERGLAAIAEAGAPSHRYASTIGQLTSP
jgi:hypothetical protein